MRLKKINEEVLFNQEDIVCIDYNDIKYLKEKSVNNLSKKLRICAHTNVDDPLHEMIIAHSKGNYIRPHKHLFKSESFHIVEGYMDVIIFDDYGNVNRIIKMGEYSSNYSFFYRISFGFYHTIIPISEIVVFHEITNGPFQKDDNVWAEWSPKEREYNRINLYIDSIYKTIDCL